MSEGYRRRLGTVLGCLIFSSAIHALFVLAYYAVSCTLFPEGLPTLAQHFLLVPLTLFTTAVPLPFGALGLSEGVSDGLFRMVSHPGGALAMMGFRVLMYAGGLVSVCFYLANLRQVRTLADSADELEQELIDGELEPDESEPGGIALPEVPRRSTGGPPVGGTATITRRDTRPPRVSDSKDRITRGGIPDETDPVRPLRPQADRDADRRDAGG